MALLRCPAWSDEDNTKTSTAFGGELTTTLGLLANLNSKNCALGSVLPLIHSKKSNAKMISISAKDEFINISIKYFYNQYWPYHPRQLNVF